MDSMKEGQNEIYCIASESIAMVSSSSFLANLRKKGYEVSYMAEPVDEYAVRQPEEFDETKLKPTTKEGLDLRDQDEKKTLDEKHSGHSAGHAANLEGLENKLLEKIRKVQSDDDLKHIGQERVYGRTVNHAVDVPVSQIREKFGQVIQAMQRGKRQRHSSMHQAMQEEKQEKKEQKTNKDEGGNEREDGTSEAEMKEEEGGEEEHGADERRGRKKEGGEMKKGEMEMVLGKEREQVKKDVTDWTVVTRNRRQRKVVQIFVKVNGSKATPMEVNLTNDKVEDVMRRIQNDEDAYVTMQGKVLRTSEKLKSCGVTDGCTTHVTSRVRGGGRHKVKKRKESAKTERMEHQVDQKDNGVESVAMGSVQPIGERSEQRWAEDVKGDKTPVMRECDKDAYVQMIEQEEAYRKIVDEMWGGNDFEVEWLVQEYMRMTHVRLWGGPRNRQR